MITVSTDLARRRVIAVMGDMLTVDEVIRFSEDEQAAVRSMGLSSGEFDLLVVTIGNLVQTQEVMLEFQRLMIESPLKARRIATVRDGILTRMQSKRVAKMRSGSEVFDSRAAAEAWLAEPVAQAA